MKRTTLLLVIILTIALSACKPSPEVILASVNQTQTALPTATAYPSLTPYDTYTPYPTYTPQLTNTPVFKIVTPTFTATPELTPTITSSPTITPIPTNTPDPLQALKRPGIYLVNVDIAPGVWRSTGTGDECYWKRMDRTGDIIDNHYGFAGGTIYISPNDFSVELDRECGNWEYISAP